MKRRVWLLWGMLAACGAEKEASTGSELTTGVCGDGNRNVGEACDDGNVVSGDGCTDQCAHETIPVDGSTVTVTTSSEYSATFPGENLVDGNTATYWIGGAGSGDRPWTVTFDFGQDRRISRFELDFYHAYGADEFDVEYSTDGQNFFLVYDGFSNAGNTQSPFLSTSSFNFGDLSMRAIRVIVRQEALFVPVVAEARFDQWLLNTCGDGVAAEGEECDDGNANGGDGCDANCVREANLLPAPTAAASTSYASFAPARATDGDVGTFWAGGYPESSWTFTLTLAGPSYVDELQLDWWRGYGADDFDVELSRDGGMTWMPLAVGLSEPAGATTPPYITTTSLPIARQIATDLRVQIHAVPYFLPVIAEARVFGIENAVVVETVCDDQLDGDDDRLTDCADPDCASAPHCYPVCPGDALAPYLSPDRFGWLSNNLDGQDHSFGSCGGSGDIDAAYSFIADQDGTYALVPLNVDPSLVVYALAGENGMCTSEELGCYAGATAQPGDALTFTASAQQEVIIVVEGPQAGSTNFSFQMVATGRTTEAPYCNDGIDADGDQLIDCADPDCAAEPYCYPVCPGDQLEPYLSPDRFGSLSANLDGQDHSSGSCGGAGAIDAAYAFTPDQDGLYTFQPISVDTSLVMYALAAQNGLCTSNELDCYAGASAQPGDGLSIDVAAGEEVILVIDGASPQASPWVSFQMLASGRATEDPYCNDRIDSDDDGLIDCADPDCASVPYCYPVCPGDALAPYLSPDRFGSLGANLDGLDHSAGSCGGAGGIDAAYGFTPVQSGTYAFEPISVDPSLVFYALEGQNGLCTANELDCYAGASAQPGDALTVTVAAGEEVVLVVDGASPQANPWVSFQMRATGRASEDPYCNDQVDSDGDGLIDCADPDCATAPFCYPVCPGDALAPYLSSDQFGWINSFLDGLDHSSGSCGGAGAIDAAYSYAPTQSGTYSFVPMFVDPTVVFYALEAANGLCTSTELDCYAGSTAQPGDGLTVTLAAGEEVILVLDGATPQSQPNLSFQIVATGRTTEDPFCGDQVDSDGDGLIDCADPDCASAPPCP